MLLPPSTRPSTRPTVSFGSSNKMSTTTHKSPMYTLFAMIMLNKQKKQVVETVSKTMKTFLTRSVTAATSAVTNPGLWQRYMTGLAESPYTYKGMTSGGLKALSKLTAVAINGKQANARQIIGTFVYGYTIDTWMNHNWYTYGLPPCEKFLINATVGQNAPTLLKVLITTIFSSVVFDLPYSMVYGFSAGLLSGLYGSVEEAYNKTMATAIEFWMDGLKVWPGFTFLCMFLLPRDLVVPAGNLIGYFYNTFFMLKQARLAAAFDKNKRN